MPPMSGPAQYASLLRPTAMLSRFDRRRGRDQNSAMWRFAIIVGLCALLSVGGSRAHAADAAFTAFLQSLWPEAQKLGVSRAAFDAATAGLEPDLSFAELVIPGPP